MNLSFKDAQFILEAIVNLLNTYDRRLEEIEGLEEFEDEAADLGNDYMFLESLRLEINKNLVNNDSVTVSLSPTIISQYDRQTSLEAIVDRCLKMPINERLLLVEAIVQSIRKEDRLMAG